MNDTPRSPPPRPHRPGSADPPPRPRPGRPRSKPSPSTASPREEILRAAAALFSRQGVGASRISDLAAAVGISPPALYYHFANLDEIVSALLDYVVTESAAFATTMAMGTGRPTERLRSLIAQHVARLVGGPYDLWFVAGLPEADQRRYPIIGRRAAAWRRAVAKLVDEGVAAGEFEDCDVALCVAAISGLVYGALQHHHHGQRVDPDAVAELAIRLLRR